MHVLQNKRKFPLAAIAVTARLADGARRRVSPKRLVIRAAIIITGKTKSGGRPQDKQSGRKWQPVGNPRGLCAEQAVRRSAEQFGRIKRRKIIRAAAAIPVMLALKRRPRRIHDESRKRQKNRYRIRPPGASAHCLPEGASYRKTCGSHSILLKPPARIAPRAELSGKYRLDI